MNAAQLRAMIWLRWRLTLNQWRRGGQLNAVVSMILVIACLCLAVVGGVAGVVGGALGLSKASPQATMLAWDGLVAMFLFFWTIGIIIDLQRSEILDLGRFLCLPVSLRDVFLLNYLASHFSLSLALSVPAMLGLTIGLALGRGATMLLLLPPLLGFFFMITAWTYCLRSWLATLMINKRRRRAIVVGITHGVRVAVFSCLNCCRTFGSSASTCRPRDRPRRRCKRGLASRVEAQRRIETAFDLTHRCVPFLWLPYGAKALAQDSAWPALAARRRHVRHRGIGVQAGLSQHASASTRGPKRRNRFGRLPARKRSARTEGSSSSGRCPRCPKRPPPWPWPASARCCARRK